MLNDREMALAPCPGLLFAGHGSPLPASAGLAGLLLLHSSQPLGVGKDRRLLVSPAAKFFRGNKAFGLAERSLSHLFF